MSEAIVELRDTVKYFPVKEGVLRKTVGHVHAVDHVSFKINRGETFGLVGESGCGKTTLGRCVLRLLDTDGGQILFEGEDITKYKKGDLRKLRRDMQIVFQDPQSSLDPRMTVKAIVGEPLKVFGVAKGRQAREYVLDLLQKVGLNPEHLNRFPHEFSGGQRQRIGVARALALSPKFIVMDEPTSSLDVSVQAQILNLMKDLQSSMNLTYLFISHNLSVIKHMSDRIGVMYVGKLVEVASKLDLYNNPLHPYAKALLVSIPVPDPRIKRDRIILPGNVPSAIAPPPGCRFHPRCPIATEICSKVEPALLEIQKDHWVACHHAPGYPEATQPVKAAAA